VVEQCCELALRVEAEPLLELAAPVTLNVVCFRYRAGDETQAAIATDLQNRAIWCCRLGVAGTDGAACGDRKPPP
jgi:glutamate/tyrosine decarboxylase-like PLP-dependent enzyme